MWALVAVDRGLASALQRICDAQYGGRWCAGALRRRLTSSEGHLYFFAAQSSSEGCLCKGFHRKLPIHVGPKVLSPDNVDHDLVLRCSRDEAPAPLALCTPCRSTAIQQ